MEDQAEKHATNCVSIVNSFFYLSERSNASAAFRSPEGPDPQFVLVIVVLKCHCVLIDTLIDSDF